MLSFSSETVQATQIKYSIHRIVVRAFFMLMIVSMRGRPECIRDKGGVFASLRQSWGQKRVHRVCYVEIVIESLRHWVIASWNESRDGFVASFDLTPFALHLVLILTTGSWILDTGYYPSRMKSENTIRAVTMAVKMRNRTTDVRASLR